MLYERVISSLLKSMILKYFLILSLNNLSFLMTFLSHNLILIILRESKIEVLLIKISRQIKAQS